MRKLLLALSAVLCVSLAASALCAEVPEFLNAESEAVDAEDGCVLPDVAGLSADEAAAAFLAAGFETRSEKAEKDRALKIACPTTFSCSSITNCGVDLPTCNSVSLGVQCCTVSPGVGRCCLGGTIKQRTCNCKCTGIPCAINCPSSNDVSLHC